MRTRNPPQVGSPVPPAKEADGEQLMALVAPAPPELVFPLIALGWVWLKRLKFSHRNSKAYRSLKAKRLKSPKSKLTRPGRRNKFRPESPNVKPTGSWKASGLYAKFPKGPFAAKAAFTSAGTLLGLPTKSGNEVMPVVPLALPALSPNVVPLVGVNGSPV